MIKFPPLKTILGCCVGVKYGAVIEGSTPRLVKSKKLKPLLDKLSQELDEQIDYKLTVSDYAVLRRITDNYRSQVLPDLANYTYSARTGCAEVFDTQADRNVLKIVEHVKNPLRSFLRYQK